MKNIQFMDLQKQYQSIKSEIDAAIFKVLESSEYIGGPIKENFEKNFAKACGTSYCLGVGNGTDAITIALKAMGIGPGDEVITQANSFIASSEAISTAGAKPVFVDVDPANFLMDFAKLEALLEKQAHTKGGKIKAIIPVHLYGRILNMTKLMALADKYKLKVLEDCAQSHLATWNGKKAGSFGDMATFSFYPGKNLGAYGDAGAIVTSNEQYYNLAKKLANHGRVQKYDHEIEGYNSRLDTIQAAILDVKLKYLQNWSDARYDKAVYYSQKLAGISSEIALPEIPEKGSHVFHLYVIRVKNREKLQKHLQDHGIPTIVHYPISLPNLKAYAHMGHSPDSFPVATQLQNEVLSLPLFPEITSDEQNHICAKIKEFYAQ